MNQVVKNAGKLAWVIAIGDELISGQRLDTNSQWLSQRLEQLGAQVVRHCSVGDTMSDGVAAFKEAVKTADLIVCTGGIGPTKDDLTRQVIAEVAGVELELIPEIENHIKSIFASYGREMPDNNLIQACFPKGAKVIRNPEGTAPGIDLVIGDCRVFALPGVPYEMKQMWEDHVESAIVSMQGQQQIIRHHAVHCFGAGESQVELMLEGMTERDHQPRVGITASQSTISLRITAAGNDEAECQQQIDFVAERIQSKLGNLVFGQNGVQLEDVVVSMLSERNKSVAMADFAFGGIAAGLLHQADQRNKAFFGGRILVSKDQLPREELIAAARETRSLFSSDYSVAVSQLYKSQERRMYDLAIVGDCDPYVTTLQYGGHSGLRRDRTAKQILNEVRLFLESSV